MDIGEAIRTAQRSETLYARRAAWPPGVVTTVDHASSAALIKWTPFPKLDQSATSRYDPPLRDLVTDWEVVERASLSGYDYGVPLPVFHASFHETTRLIELLDAENQGAHEGG